MINKDSIEIVHNLLSEYFQAVCLVGYTLCGKKVQINLYNTPMEADALETALRDALDSFEPPPEVIIHEKD